MRLLKNISDGYIDSISSGSGEIEITETEYNTILQKIRTKPTDPKGYQYRLLDITLQWELVEMPEPDPEPLTDEASPEDYENALAEMGVDFSD